MKIKRCRYCGKLFDADVEGAGAYCSPVCRVKWQDRGSANREIICIAREALDAGMSYGKYVALQRMKKMKKGKKNGN